MHADHFVKERERNVRSHTSDEPAHFVVKNKKYETGGACRAGKPGFASLNGNVEFTSELLRSYGLDPLPTYKEPTESPISTPELAKEYPLILNFGSCVPMYTHSKQRDLMPEPIIRLNPVAAKARGIENGDMVELVIRHGKVQEKAEITNTVREDTIDMFHGWEKANVNLVHARDFDPISGFPSYKEGLCDVRKI